MTICISRSSNYHLRFPLPLTRCSLLLQTVSRAQPLPVMVWIHGGGFSTGSGFMYGPEYILDKDVIFVSFNYRLGPLGFLSSGDGVIAGNFGMKDQVQALRWVRDNIAAFGGDPNQVTIFGESAGGASVHALLISPLAKGACRGQGRKINL